MAKRIFSNITNTNEEKVTDLLACTVVDGECRVWTRALNTDGYPAMFNNVKVHRLVYQLVNDEDITGLVVRHTCDNPKCINPDHLLKGTPTDNMRDRDERDRHHRVITKDIVTRVNQLLTTKALSQKEIALIVDIDQRRVSDISNGKYDSEGRFWRR